MTSANALPTGWIKVWTSLGLVVTLLGIFLPAAISNVGRMEVQRYQECAAGSRQDCKTSIVWMFYEQALKEQGGNALLMENLLSP